MKSVSDKEVLVFSEAIDDSKGIAHALSEILISDIKVHLYLESKDLFAYLNTAELHRHVYR